jgi:hypothetical protein
MSSTPRLPTTQGRRPVTANAPRKPGTQTQTAPGDEVPAKRAPASQRDVDGFGDSRLEFVRARPASQEWDGGVTLKWAAAVTTFKKLQDDGRFIERGTTFNQVSDQLTAMVRDANGNGRFELDLAALAGSGLLKGKPSVDALKQVLEGRTPAGTVSNGFLKNVKVAVDKESLQVLSNGLELRTERDAAQLNSLRSRAGSNPRAVAKESVAAAQVFAAKGKKTEGLAVLEAAGSALQQAGRFAEAREVYTELTRSPWASEPRHLLRDEIDLDSSARSKRFNESTDVLTRDSAGNHLEIDTVNFSSTVGDVAQLRLRQLALQERMTATLGRAVDPKSMTDAAAYFQAFAAGRDASAVAQEFGAYLDAGFAHVGQGVEWNPAIAPDARGARLDEVLSRQQSDEAGRRLIDCEGYAYLADGLLGGIKNADGSSRFTVEYASKPGHVVAAVTEAATSSVFVVNNQRVSKPQTYGFEGDRKAQVARALCGDAPGVLGISRQQSKSEPQDKGSTGVSPLRVGSFAWTGKRLVEITPQLDASRHSFVSTNPNSDFSDWIRAEFGG